MGEGIYIAVQLPSCVQLFVTPWTAACQESLFTTISLSLPKFMSIVSVMPSNHLILCCPLFLLPSVLPSIRNFSRESAVHILICVFSSQYLYQFTSAQSCLTLCYLMNCSTPGLPVHHQLPEFTQTHVHRVSDAIQPSHPLLSPSSPALNPSQHQSLFQ